jgi:alpha-glucosidase
VKTFLSRLVLILFAVSAPAVAAAEERFELRSGAEVLEITALRPDILRIRQGSGSLPEDASWAVPSELRSLHAPLKVTRGPQGVVVDAGALVVQIDP